MRSPLTENPASPRRRRPLVRVADWLTRLGVLVITAFVLTIFGVTLLAWTVPDPARVPTAPMIIVLGAGMAADGTLGVNTIRRFEDGLALVEMGRADRIHFSGGDIHRGITEGSLMARTARARFPEVEITYEDRSRSTLQNAWFTLETLGEVPPGSLLVTDSVHLFRAWASFQWAGARGLVPVAALRLDEIPKAERPRRILREALGVWLNGGRAVVFSLRRLFGAEPEKIVPILAF